MQIITILLGCISEMLAILIEGDVLCEIVQILILTGTVSDSSVASFDVG